MFIHRSLRPGTPHYVQQQETGKYKSWFIYTIGYYAAIKKNKLLTHKTSWIPLIDMLWHQRSQDWLMLEEVRIARLPPECGWLLAEKWEDKDYFWVLNMFILIWMVIEWVYTNTPVAQRLKCLPAMWEIWVRSLGWEDPLEKEMATHSSILAWRIPWTEEPGRLQSTGSQRVGHDWATSLHFTSHKYKTPRHCRFELF